MSGIHDESKLQEQKRVDHVINVIDQKMEQLQEKTGSLKEHIVSLRKTFGTM